MSVTAVNSAVRLFASCDRLLMELELLTVRAVLAEADSFHAMTVEEQSRAVAEQVAINRATVAASPELQAWIRSGMN